MSVEKDKPTTANGADSEPAASPSNSSAKSVHTGELVIFDGSTKEAPRTEAPRSRQWPLAASIAIAAMLGGLAGAAAMVHWAQQAAPTAETRTADAARPLHDDMAQLSHDIAALKAAVAVVERNTSLQSSRLGERLERLEKAQAEPAAKLAKLTEAVERLERRSIAASPQSTGDITGSIAAEAKSEAKPLYADGWRLHDYYAGRAVVESRNGRLFEIGPGSNLPGLGRVDAIKREDGRVVVVTRNGLIAASIEPRRMPRPYRF
jgi:hypothetical protein